MENMSINSQPITTDAENMILLELFVQQVLLNETVDRNLVNGKSYVDFQFLDNPPIPLEDQRKAVNRPLCQATGELNLGKSCLFSLTPQEMQDAMQVFDIFVKVYKSQVCGNQQKVLVGMSLVPLSRLLKDIMKKLPRNTPDGSPGTSKTMQNSYVLNNLETGEEVGYICVFVRLTSFGKYIQTQFQMDMDDTSVEYKANQAHYKVKYNKKFNACPDLCMGGKSCADPSCCGMVWPPAECPKVQSSRQQNNPYSQPCQPSQSARQNSFGPQCAESKAISSSVPCVTRDSHGCPCMLASPVCPKKGPMQAKMCGCAMPPYVCEPCVPCVPCPVPVAQPQPPSCCNRKPVPMVYASEANYGKGPMDEFRTDLGPDGCFCCRIHDEKQPNPIPCPANYLQPPTMNDQFPLPSCNTNGALNPNSTNNGPPCAGPRDTSPRVIELRPGANDHTPFRFQIGDCCGKCQNLCVSPPTYEADDGTKYVEFSDKNKKCFVMRIGKKYEGTMGGRNNIDLFLTTPPPADDDVDCEDRDTQYKTSDFDGSLNKSGWLGAGNKGTKGGKGGGKKGKGGKGSRSSKSSKDTGGFSSNATTPRQSGQEREDATGGNNGEEFNSEILCCPCGPCRPCPPCRPCRPCNPCCSPCVELPNCCL